MFGSLGVHELFVILVVALLLLWPTWRILAKTGFPPAISLVGVIPGGIFVLYLFLAFVEWPIQGRARLAGAYPAAAADAFGAAEPQAVRRHAKRGVWRTATAVQGTAAGRGRRNSLHPG